MYQRLVLVSLTINIVSLVLGVTLIVVVLVLTLSVAADASSKTNETEAFGFILSLGPLLIISALCGITASQRSSTSVLALYWATLMTTVTMSIWLTGDYLDISNAIDNLTAIQIISRLVAFICAIQIVSIVLVTLTNFQNGRVSNKDRHNVQYTAQESTQLDDYGLSSGPGIQLVSTSKESSSN